MEQAMWNKWIKKIDNSSVDEMNYELSIIENDEKMPFVEKNFKLGYLYYSKDCLGTATKIFKSVVEKISAEKNNFDFIKENGKDINIVYEDYEIEPDGNGGWKCREVSKGNELGCCICCGGLLAIPCCGIQAADISTCDTTDGQGCLDNCLNGCCGCCDDFGKASGNSCFSC